MTFVCYQEIYCKLFQYEGEIQVLYQVTVVQTLTNKKWAGKELPVKAGENLDVIVKAMDNKLICRNEEGKCEYLLLDIKKINQYMFSRFLLLFHSLHHKSGPSIHLSNTCLSVFYSWLCFDQPHCYGVSNHKHSHIHTHTDKIGKSDVIIYCMYWTFAACLQRWWYLRWYWRWYVYLSFRISCEYVVFRYQHSGLKSLFMIEVIFNQYYIFFQIASMTTIEKHPARGLLFYADIAHVIYFVYGWYTLGASRG